MIIAITGHTHAGKSSVAKMFQRELRNVYKSTDRFPIRKFSQPLRDTLKTITGLHDWEHLKTQPLPEIWQNDLVKNGRDIHKAVGEGLKTFLGSDVWAKAFFERWRGEMIIDDLRYDSEISYMQYLREQKVIPPYTVIKINASLRNRASRGGVDEKYLAHLDRRDDVNIIPYDIKLNNDELITPDYVRYIINSYIKLPR